MKRWWAEKHNTTVQGSGLMRLAPAEILQEFYVDCYKRKAELEEDIRECQGEELNFLLEQLTKVKKALGELQEGDIFTGDPLADYWEWQDEQGEEPDLDMTISDLDELIRLGKWRPRM